MPTHHRCAWQHAWVATTLMTLAAGSTTKGVQADVNGPFRFGSTMGSHMVLDQSAPVVWGWGTPGATVTTLVTATVPTATQASSLTTTVDTTGVWRQSVPAPSLPGLVTGHVGLRDNTTRSPSFTAYTITSSTAGSPPMSLTDVLFGHVLLCSGQSNIDTITVEHAFNASAEIAAALLFPHVRIFNVAQDSSDTKERDLRQPPTIPWTAPTNATIPTFSATCWFVARNLYNELGGTVPIGVVQSASGGTAVRNWAPIEALAKCPQPYNSPDKYGTHPYMHAVLYNAMIHPFTTAPTAFSFVVWDQAESDSFPQTPLGYYGCQTVAQINAWRLAFAAPALPWVFVHLQPYTGSGPCCLEDLRAMQLQALGLPATGFASAMDLGDPTSPYGNVHFQNKQVVARRLTAVALQLAFGRPRTNQGVGAWPPPSFLTQSVATSTSTWSVYVNFSTTDNAPIQLMFGATVDPLNQSSAVCPSSVDPSNCSAFEILTSDGVWHPAEASIVNNGQAVLLQANVTQHRGNTMTASARSGGDRNPQPNPNPNPNAWLEVTNPNPNPNKWDSMGDQHKDSIHTHMSHTHTHMSHRHEAVIETRA
eukprot:m.84665 g.84665  ORF g.84665 m.84665 type:complete len:592 (-) comp9603_c0_seq1:3750-5525(-)